jgi:hypothetical protein
MMPPDGTGTKVAAPGTDRVVVEGITFSVMLKVAGPPGRADPPAEPVPPAEFQTVLTRMEKESVPVKVGVGGV